jgi:hypothetical protein
MESLYSSQSYVYLEQPVTHIIIRYSTNTSLRPTTVYSHRIL